MARLLTEQDASQRLGLSVRTLQTWRLRLRRCANLGVALDPSYRARRQPHNHVTAKGLARPQPDPVGVLSTDIRCRKVPLRCCYPQNSRIPLNVILAYLRTISSPSLELNDSGPLFLRYGS